MGDAMVGGLGWLSLRPPEKQNSLWEDWKQVTFNFNFIPIWTLNLDIVLMTFVSSCAAERVNFNFVFDVLVCNWWLARKELRPILSGPNSPVPKIPFLGQFTFSHKKILFIYEWGSLSFVRTWISFTLKSYMLKNTSDCTWINHIYI